MNWQVVPSRWVVDRQVYTRGDVVEQSVLEGHFGSSRVDGFRRLGLIVPAKPATKPQLLAEAEKRGIEVPAKATKAQIVKLLEE